eukprot:scaffold155208_cov17-Tisochrysis_lutea.AAC.3
MLQAKTVQQKAQHRGWGAESRREAARNTAQEWFAARNTTQGKARKAQARGTGRTSNRDEPEGGERTAMNFARAKPNNAARLWRRHTYIRCVPWYDICVMTV